MRPGCEANTRDVACDGKVKLTLQQTQEIRQRKHRRGSKSKKRDDKTMAYRCIHCGWYHLGSSIVPKSQRRPD